MNKLKQFWSNLLGSFWFLPSLIVAGSLAVAVALIQVDTAGGQQWMSRWPLLFGSSASGARGVLSTIAGSMMTVLGVTFSMLLVTLALASSQYTSRILRNFMRDRVTQVVLGIFAGVFIYCLIVLRTIRGTDAAGSIPSLAVTFGVVLAISGIGALIFFIHHIAASIQASSIIASVAEKTLVAIDWLFPQKFGETPVDDDEDQSPLPLPERNWQAVPARVNGYIQSVDNAALLRLAREHQTIVRMEHGIGEFVVQNTTLASLALEAPPEPELIAALQAAYSIHRLRTVEEDAAFGIRQIVDMALRALSPGINDTTTAVMCVDYLTAILARLASRNIPSSHRYEEGELRLITIGPTFAGLVGESFDQIRGSAGGNLGVMLRMLGALQTIGSLTTNPSRRRALCEEAQWIAELADRTIESPHDRERFESRLANVREALGGDGKPT
ncbi:DUF2254 domain-containing protein [Oceanisphaera arctica]|uniref:DUF2254 domain-containing protein n=1 Tax=Oceanisphaera arctica TaxID=641510 RepID=A0A2P5TJB2_9GAMM|nr:DUF2254 domain-containing protein [Oceanisphaera arctica]PPL14971.1 hypothetical protein UN63_14200 [Oceanisphaera arctica]GHA19774.1 hypothetical protein GCM10007082_20580 [Oceanisphaera arctica]